MEQKSATPQTSALMAFKKKMGQVITSNKKTILFLKRKLDESQSKNTEYEAKIEFLEGRLKEELTKNNQLQDQISLAASESDDDSLKAIKSKVIHFKKALSDLNERRMREQSEYELTINRLESELREERSRLQKMMDSMSSSGGSDDNIDALKDAAYAAAKIESLEQQVTLSNQNANKIKEEFKNKMAAMQEGLKKEIGKNEMLQRELNEKLIETEDKLKEFAHYPAQIEENQKMLDEKNQSIESLGNKIEELNGQLQQLVEEKAALEDEIASNNQMINELEERNRELYSVTQKFDVEKIKERVRLHKNTFEDVLLRENQAELIENLENINKTEDQLKFTDKEIRFLFADLKQDIIEVKEGLKNHIIYDEI